MDAVGQKGVEQDLLEIKTTQKNPQTQPRPVSMDWRPSHCKGQGQSGALLQLYPKPFWEKILYMAHGQGNSHTSKGHARLSTFPKMKEKLQNQGRSRGRGYGLRFKLTYKLPFVNANDSHAQGLLGHIPEQAGRQSVHGVPGKRRARG